MKSYAIRIVLCIIILGSQYFFSRRKNILLLFIMPLISLIAGVIYLNLINRGISLSTYKPYISICVCLIIFGFIERNVGDNKVQQKS